ncbi:MAG: aspartate carbamoyltransferase regulatory subunit [Clostridiales Family XIII bacterium]|jgi:aspartate carbamoyltransferase regulatory subunit|nr:aspartate carbamoyltransferase regulatory subunit [Clostridiales Family XIII bacterium]
MEINSIEKGLVIDHIKAGFGLRVLDYLNIDKTGGMVALIMNASSKKHDRKDIIKIEGVTDIDITALGLLDHGATVNVIENGEITRKIKLSLPEKVVNVITCKNPRCVTSVEPALPQTFHLVDAAKEEYCCAYCEETVRVADIALE